MRAIISPFARKGFVDHTQYDTTSILKTIEVRWSLTPLTSRDAAANDLSPAFDFNQTPSAPATPPVTGGQNQILFLAALCGGVMVVVSGVIVLRRKRWAEPRSRLG